MNLPDARARQRAITTFSTNLVVTAGAGTGKTSLLVGRLLAALVTQHMDPAQILAVTFTENAAAEMHERLLRLLRAVEPWLDGRSDEIEASDAAVLETLQLGPENRRRVDEILENAETLPISTFHAWCARFLSDHAPRLNLPPDLRIGDEEAVRRAHDEDFLTFLRERTATESPDALARFEPAQLRDLAWQLATLPETSQDRALGAVRPGAEELAARRKSLGEARQRFASARPQWIEYVEKLEAALRDLAEGRDLDDGAWLDKAAPKAGTRQLGAADAAIATDAATEQRNYLRAWLQADEESIGSALAFLRPFLAWQRGRRAERGELTFDDLLLMTRRALEHKPDLRRRAAQGLRAILVDEFQDTDPLQYDVLFLLAAEPQSVGSDPYALPLRPGVLCIVGDAKQSIYRFRRADITAFSRAVQHVLDQGGEQLDLTANFRSLAPVLDVVNRVCTRSLAKAPPYQFEYVPVTAMRETGEAASVELLDLGEPGLNASQRRLIEGKAIVSTLDRLQREGVALSAIAILLRAATDLNWLLRPLRRAGIPYVLEGSTRFYRRHEVVLASALIAAIARPHDAVAVLGMLRSVFSSATDREIALHLRGGGSLDYRLASDGDGPVHECLRRLHELWSTVGTLPVNRALEALLRCDELTLGEGAGFEGAQRLANLERLLHRLLALGPLDLANAADLLRTHTDRETEDEESPLFDRETEAVRLLTVHRAKGLEFEAVIVPDIARSAHHPRGDGGIAAQRFFDAEGRELVSVQIGQARNVAAGIMREEEKRHREAEDRRLFYVAATRARRRLVLVCNRGAKAPWQADLEAAEPLGAEDLTYEETPQRSFKAAAAFDPRPTLDALARHREILASEPAAPSTTPSQLDEHRATPLAEEPDAVARRDLGVAAHRYLALVDFERSAPDPDLLEGCGDAAVHAELRDIAARFHASPLRERLRSARRVWREVAIAYTTPTGTVHGTIDALAETADGALVVIDYKTDRVAADAADRAARRFRAQLHAYRDGVIAALRPQRPPTCEVHFLRADATVEV